MSKSKLVVVVLTLCIVSSCATNQTKNQTENTVTTPNANGETKQARNSRDVVKATGLPTEIKRNETGDAVVEVSIEKGYHVNANPPTLPYLKATELEIAPPPGTSISFIVYPNAISKTFAFSDKPLSVYEGTTTIKAKLKVDKSATPGTQNLSGKLNVQACDDQVCYAPGTLDVSIPLSIK